VILRTPDRPSTRFVKNASESLPVEAITPRPVTTTLRTLGLRIAKV
jgi:hypothetical protein